MPDDPNKQTPANCPQCGRSFLRGDVSGLCASCLADTAFLWNDDEDTALPSALSADVPSVHLGDYDLIEEIGRGGMGTVWRARQRSLGREVALKVLPSGPLADAEFLARFREEARLAAKLHHPNIVAIHEVGEADGHAFFSMDQVPGPTLTQRVRADGPMEPRAAAVCLERIARGMQHAHDSGVLHRDLKPSNILLEPDGSPRVADFGLAKAIADGEGASNIASDLTLTRAVLGTPHFIAPEQARGASNEIDQRTDAHGLGAVLYFALTARPPFAGDSVSTVLHEAQHQEPPAPRLLSPTLPRDLETICLKCLEKSPARRYATAGDFADDLQCFLDSKPVQARPPSAAYRAGKFLRRHRVLVLAVSAVVMSLLSGLIGTVKMAIEARRSAGEATASAVSATASERRALASEAAAIDLAERARRDEERALTSEAESRRALSMGDLHTAVSQSDEGRGVDAVMHLARAVRTDPDNSVAVARLLSELANTDFARPIRPQVDVPEFIRDIRFSADSRRLMVSCQEHLFGFGMVQLYDAVTGADTTPVPLRSVRTSCGNFSPDGRWLALGSPGRMGLYDPATGILDREFPFEGVAVSCTWSLDGSLMAATGLKGSGGITRVWSVETGATIIACDETAPVEPVHWSGDGRKLAINGPGLGITAYDAETGEAIRSFSERDERHRLYAQAFTRDGRGLAILEASGPLRLFDLQSGEEVGVPFAPDPGMFPGGTPSPDGGMLVMIGESNAARVWDLDLRQPVPVPSVAERFLSGAAFTPDGGMVVLPSSSSDSAAIFFDLHSASFARPTLRLPGGAVVAAVSPDGTRVACGGRSRKLGLYDLRHLAAKPLVIPHQEILWQVAFSADDASVIAMGEQGRVTSWNAVTAKRNDALVEDGAAARLDLSEGLRGHRATPWMTDELEFPASGSATIHRWLHEVITRAHGTVLAAALSPDGTLVATGGRDHTLRLWHRADATQVQAEIKLPRSIAALAFNSTGTRLAAGTTDGRVLAYRVPDMNTGVVERSASLVGQVRSLTWKPGSDGTRRLPVCVATGGISGVSLFFPEEGRTLRLDGPTDEVRQMSWNHDGTRLAAGTASGAAWLWDGSGKLIAGPLRHLSGPHYSGLLVRLSPDGSLLATGGAHDGSVRLWSAIDGLAHGVLPTGRMGVDLAFDPTGERIAVASDGILIWDVATAQPLTTRWDLPDVEIPIAIAWNSDGTRLAAASRGGALFVRDLPPHVPRSPDSLAAFAEAFVGWRLDIQGLAQPVPDAERIPTLSAMAQGS
ncbi:MAG: protein kinase, partial [Verrucomicrobia bacterium]|nr:protein kinase [Verrucomicrobiota bacterium]